MELTKIQYEYLLEKSNKLKELESVKENGKRNKI